MPSSQRPQPTSASPGSLEALGVSWGAALFTILLGAGTNKVVAAGADVEGVALIGLYRSITTIVVTFAAFGIDNVLAQRLSSRRDASDLARTFGATLAFLLVQSVALLVAAFALGAPLARLVFSAGRATDHVPEVRLVLTLAIGVLALRVVTAMLQGLGRVREVSVVNVTTSALTLLTAYPFLALGRIGLTLILGATCFVGAGLGARALRRAVPSSQASIVFPAGWRAFHDALPLSPWASAVPLLFSGHVLLVQTLVNRRYGLEPLGYLSAATLVEGTAVMILTSPLRSYYLPGLARLSGHGEQRDFTDGVLRACLVLLLAGGTALILAGRTILHVLFSARFDSAAGMLVVLTLSMVPQLLMWFAVMAVLRKGNHRAFFLLEGGRIFVDVLAMVACVLVGSPVIAMAWVHLASTSVGALLYVIAVPRIHGGALWGGRGIASVAAVLALLSAAAVLGEYGPVAMRAIFALVVGALCLWKGRNAWTHLRR